VLSRQNRVLWVNSIGYRRPSLNKADAGRIVQKMASFTRPMREVEPNIFVLNPVAIPGFTSSAVRAFNQRLLRWQVMSAMRRLGFQRPINWVCNPAAAVVAGKLGEEALVYYCVDEYSALSGVDTTQLQALERQLTGRADAVIVSAEELLRSKSRLNPKTALVRHGVDFEHFCQALDEQTIVPADIRDLPRPVIGYFGLISDDWFDIGLMVKVAKQFAAGTVVLLGKVTSDLAQLRALPNVLILGRKSYSALPAYCKGFDVAVIPFPVSPLTQNSNPLKAREYLAAGLPVVSTAVPEVEALGSCRIAPSADAFLAQIAAALVRPGPDPARSEAMRHDGWPARVSLMVEHLQRFGVLGTEPRDKFSTTYLANCTHK
jgi:glycosyltransferase involved in cell wall biosynthesis